MQAHTHSANGPAVGLRPAATETCECLYTSPWSPSPREPWTSQKRAPAAQEVVDTWGKEGKKGLVKKKQKMTIGQEDNSRDGVGCERHVVELCRALQKLRS